MGLGVLLIIHGGGGGIAKKVMKKQNKHLVKILREKQSK